MKTIITISTIFSLSIILTGCLFSNCEKIDLKNEDLKKLDFYNGLKYLVFKSNLGKIDTLTVTYNDFSYSPCNKFELSEFQYQSRGVSFKNSGWHGDTYSGISFSLDNQYRDDSSAVFYLYVHCAMSQYEKSESVDTITNNYLSKTFISKKFRWDGSAGSGKDNEIHDFHWNDTIGLIRYTTHAGEEYDLIKRGF